MYFHTNICRITQSRNIKSNYNFYISCLFQLSEEKKQEPQEKLFVLSYMWINECKWSTSLHIHTLEYFIIFIYMLQHIEYLVSSMWKIRWKNTGQVYDFSKTKCIVLKVQKCPFIKAHLTLLCESSPKTRTTWER